MARLGNKVNFETLGCKLNFAESSAIKGKLVDAGFEMVEEGEKAQFYVLNTCSVTEFADKKCRQFVRRAKRQNAQAQILVIGCYAQLQPQEIASIDGVTSVLNARDKFTLPTLLKNLQRGYSPEAYQACEILELTEFEHSSSGEDRTRAFLKVQDGCDYGCAFCTIPQARGKSRSPRMESLLNKAEALVQQGFKEIVLTGVNTGDFGKGDAHIGMEKQNLFQLLKAISAIEHLPRLRVSSIEPNLLSPEIIELVAERDNLMPHFHIPLQSGCNKTLKNMRRRYLSALYAEKVQEIKSKIPHACIGADVIVGFPEEEDEDFLESYSFIEGLPLSYLHVFTYSSRKNTYAAELPQIPMNKRRKRNEMLRALSKTKREAFIKENLGSLRSCLFEAKIENGKRLAYTDNYIRVMGDAQNFKENDIQLLKLGEMRQDGLVTLVWDPSKQSVLLNRKETVSADA